MCRPKEDLTARTFQKTGAQNVIDLFEPKEGRKYEHNFLGSPIKETWPAKQADGPLFVEDSVTSTAAASLSSSTVRSTRRKANVFVTGQGSITSLKFITQRSHNLSEGLHTTDISGDRMVKYFGDASKEKFYETYRELKRQKLLLPIKSDGKGGVDADLSFLVGKTMNEHPVNKSISDMVSIGAIRPSTVNSVKKKSRFADDSSSSVELYNVHSFAVESTGTPVGICSDLSVTSSISDGMHSKKYPKSPGEADDDSIFSESEKGEIEVPMAPLLPFVSIFSSEQYNDRRKSLAPENIDITQLSLESIDISPKPSSISKNPSSSKLVSTLPSKALISREGSNSNIRIKSIQGDKRTLPKTTSRLTATGDNRNRRSSESTVQFPKSTKKTVTKQHKSCIGRVDTTKRSSELSDMDNEKYTPAMTPKKLDSQDEFVSFASGHPCEPSDLHASSIDEDSEFQGEENSDIHLSAMFREDTDSDDELIRLGGDNEGYLSYGCNSPRAKFLAGCINKNLPPRNALMLRSTISSVLFLEHHGMGDDLALLLAPALAAMPLISGVNIADNNLTDIGLEAIILSIANCENVRDFDISENIIGPKAAAALAALLGNPQCKLSKITMRKANIDDGECERFVEALKDNKHLQELDMSDNLLGKDENLNAVKPDIVTAGEALASLLREGSCPLTTLKIAWNMIRMEGAYELCTALESCNTLRHVDLSFNALGRASGIALGTSIELMPNLKELLLSNNGLDPMAAFTLCVGARECPSLSYLCLDNNPVGDLGMRAILTNVVYCGSRLTISARGCDFTCATSDCSYKRSDPSGSYDINLSNGFDRAILLGTFPAALLLFLSMILVVLDAMDAVAMHQSLGIEGFQYSYEGNDLNMCITKFNEKKLPDTFDRHENEEVDSLNRMHRILSNDNVKKKMLQIFNERQHAGTVDKTAIGLFRDETIDIIEGIGRVEYTESQFKTLFAYYDVCDDLTIISSFIFIQMIEKIESEALLRIRDAVHLPRFSINGGKSRYVPPATGRLRMRVIDTFVNRPDGYGLTQYQTRMMHHVSQNHADVSIGLCAVMELFKVRCEEASAIFHILMESNGDPAKALAAILPCLTTSPDIKAIINMYGRNPTTQRRLEQRMGSAYRAYVGPIDGFYRLDLRTANDRLCLMKLMQISASNSHLRKRSGLADISQHGDWSSFRNKYYSLPATDSNEPQPELMLTNAALTPMPTSGLLLCSFLDLKRVYSCHVAGIIEFDFSGAPRGYVTTAESFSNEWFLQTLLQIGLITEPMLDKDLKWLVDIEVRQRKNSTGSGLSIWARDLGRASHISAYIHEKIFNQAQLSRRYIRLVESLAKERALQSEMAAKEKAETDAIAAKKKMEELERRRNYGRSKPGSNFLSRPSSRYKTYFLYYYVSVMTPWFFRGADTPLVKSSSGRDYSLQDVDEMNVEDEDLFPPDSDDEDARGNADSPSIVNAFSDARLEVNTTAASSADDVGTRDRKSSVAIKKSVDRYATIKAAKMMRKIIDAFDTGKLVYCRQVALLMNHFVSGSHMRTDYGSYRVEVAVALFYRMKDIQNFDIVLYHLNASEAACVIGRLGLLTTFNPMKPENCYELDMALYEQRQIAKMLMHYAVVEPGINWFNQKYSVDRNNINIPGWELPVMWNAKENLPEKGILCCRYYAGDGFCMKQCRPVKKLRFLLLSLTLVSISDLKDEEAEFLLDKSAYRQIEIDDEVYSTPGGKTRKHHAKFTSESRVQASSIPGKIGTVQDVHDWLKQLEITWTYNNLSDSHP